MGQAVSIGRVVLYTLNEVDAEAINRRRYHARVHMEAHRRDARGVVLHVGYSVSAGDEFPAAVMVRRFGGAPESRVNLQVLLDGTDTYWATSRYEGEGPGCWRWPPRVS